MTFVLTKANQRLWAITLPKGLFVEDLRREMMCVMHGWMCYVQDSKPSQQLAAGLIDPDSSEIVEKRDKYCSTEWKVDVLYQQ